MSWAEDTDGKARTEYVDREIDDEALDDLANVMELFGLRESDLHASWSVRRAVCDPWSVDIHGTVDAREFLGLAETAPPSAELSQALGAAGDLGAVEVGPEPRYGKNGVWDTNFQRESLADDFYFHIIKRLEDAGLEVSPSLSDELWERCEDGRAAMREAVAELKDEIDASIDCLWNSEEADELVACRLEEERGRLMAGNDRYHKVDELPGFPGASGWVRDDGNGRYGYLFAFPWAGDSWGVAQGEVDTLGLDRDFLERAMRSAGCRAEDFALVPTYVPNMTNALVSIVAAQEICDKYTVPNLYRGEAAAMAEVDKRRGESRQAGRTCAFCADEAPLLEYKSTQR